MPKKKKSETEYSKNATNFDNDSLDFGLNIPEPKKRGRKPSAKKADANDSGKTSADAAIEKISQEIEDAKAAAEKNKKKAAKNRASRAKGRKFEEMILRACETYKIMGRATINKVPEARRVIGRTGGRSSKMICVNDKKADPDFEGSVAPDGRCIVFDAKHTDKDRIQATALTENQRDVLELHLTCGAMCYVAVSFGFDRYFMIPYQIWRDMGHVFGRKYILPDDIQIQKYAIPWELTGEVDKKGDPIGIVWFLDKPEEPPELDPEIIQFAASLKTGDWFE